MIGKIQRIKLRDVWKHEALDFTRWLEENIDVLNDIVDLNFTSVEREKNAGSYSVDLVAEDASGDIAVIENQLEKSDHDHLGKLITYLTALEAKIAIWIVSDPRPEHVKAITWLNETSGSSFYLLKMEAIKIGESEPAPLLTLIVGPSLETREAGESRKEFSERYSIRYKFWEQLLDRAKSKTKLHTGLSPTKYSWLGTGAGKTGLGLNYAVRQHDAQVELYIDNNKAEDEGKLNERIFNELFENKDEIEKQYGNEIIWMRLEQKRACRLRVNVELGGYRDEDQWPNIHEAMINSMIKLEKSLRPYIDGLKAL